MDPMADICQGEIGQPDSNRECSTDLCLCSTHYDQGDRLNSSQFALGSPRFGCTLPAGPTSAGAQLAREVEF